MKMNRTVTLIATVLMTLISLIGCKSRPEQTITVTESTTVRNEVRDTTVLVESDTAWLTLYVDCPPERVSERSAERGTRSSIGWKATRTGTGSTIEIECNSDSLELEIELRDQIIEKLRTERETVQVPRRRNWFETTMILIGSVSLIGAVSYVIIKIITLIKRKR